MNEAQTLLKQKKQAVIAWLSEQFPAAFFKQARGIQPLKLGIFDDIMDFYERLDTPPFSKKELREALNYYSSSPAYLTCQKNNVARIDLFGNEIDVVTQQQALYAQKRYQQRYTNKTKQAFDKPTNN